MKKHTPGRWEIWDAPLDHCVCIVRQGDEEKDLFINAITEEPLRPEADVYLLATAPRLLAIGEEVLDLFRNFGVNVSTFPGPSTADRLEAIIAEAKGGIHE